MKRKDIYAHYLEALTPLFPEREARAEAHLLMEELHGVGRVDLQIDPEREEPVDASTIARLVAEIRSGRPVQYIVGRSWFYDRRFAVDERVLIPRPETEELVRWVLERLQSRRNEPLRLMDVGCGSGAIGVTLACECPCWQVTGIDQSAQALAVSRQNAEQLGVLDRMRFLQADALAQGWAEPLDVMVSNPPYVCREEQSLMQPNVLHFEPWGALFVPDDDPLLFYRRIAQEASSALSDGGMLFFEVNERFGMATVELLRSLKFREVELRKDLFDKDRMVSAVWRRL